RSPGLRPHLPRGKVHAEQLPGIAAGTRRLWRCLLRRTVDRRCRAHLTITDWGSSGECDGRPRTMSGNNRDTVFVPRNAGLMSKGFAERCAFQDERPAPA